MHFHWKYKINIPRHLSLGLLLPAIAFFCFETSSAKQTNTASQELQDYLQSAFARSDYLIRPRSPIAISIGCSKSAQGKCREITAAVQKYLTIKIVPEKTLKSSPEVAIELKVYRDEMDRRNHATEILLVPGLSQAVYDDGQCAAAQFLDGHEVQKGLVVTTLSMGDKLSHACIVSELARVSGLSFEQRFADLRSSIQSSRPEDFEASMQTVAKLITFHFGTSLRSGMSLKEASKALGLL